MCKQLFDIPLARQSYLNRKIRPHEVSFYPTHHPTRATFANCIDF